LLKTLDNSLYVLECFTRERPKWGLRELATELGLNHTVVYRILATYQKHGILTQDEETQKYRLGLKLLEYGSIIRDAFKISDVILPIMEKLAEKSNESVFLTWLDNDECICIEIIESSQDIKYALSSGSRTPLYMGASNKVIMAYLSPEAQKRIIAKGLPSKTGKSVLPEKLLQELHKIRTNGWAYTTGEYSESTFGIAVPLFDNKGRIMASLAVCGPEYRIAEAKVKETLSMLLRERDNVQTLLNKYNLELS
jgi:Transcriptional regulator